jgi:hypothetical protein
MVDSAQEASSVVSTSRAAKGGLECSASYSPA